MSKSRNTANNREQSEPGLGCRSCGEEIKDEYVKQDRTGHTDFGARAKHKIPEEGTDYFHRDCFKKEAAKIKVVEDEK